ncbi:hypothetical protein D3C72_1343250 [compost metagenome]
MACVDGGCRCNRIGRGRHHLGDCGGVSAGCLHGRLRGALFPRVWCDRGCIGSVLLAGGAPAVAPDVCLSTQAFGTARGAQAICWTVPPPAGVDLGAPLDLIGRGCPDFCGITAAGESAAHRLCPQGRQRNGADQHAGRTRLHYAGHAGCCGNLDAPAAGAGRCPGCVCQRGQ